LIDRALYLPQSWAGDPERRAAAGVPETVTFATKPQLGRAMLERAFAAGLPGAWVVGDSVYGADHVLRRCIEQHGRGYVLTVTSAQQLGLRPVADWLEDVPARAWQRLSAGDGAKGPRLYDWTYLPDRGDVAAGWQKGLLIRRKIKKPEEFTFYLTLAPTGTPLAELVRVAGTRWTVESCFETAKGEVGLDQYEVRSWTGWHRHITLAMLAHAYLAVLRKTVAGSGGKIDPRSRHRSRSATGPVAAHRARTGPARPIPSTFLPGRYGGAGTNSALAAAIGNGEPTLMKPGCSTRAQAGVAVNLSVANDQVSLPIADQLDLPEA